MLRTLAEAEAWLIRNTSYGGGAEPRPRRRDLEPIAGLLEEARLPQERFPVIQVVGTRGKGSTACYLAQLLRARGLRVGLYTSPHLVRLTERIRVDGTEIPGERFAAALSAVLELRRAVGASFFDLLTGLALLHFAEEGVEAAVLEAGKGGAADATSAAGARLVLFTGLGRDHMDVLGERPEQRALAKAGALRPGATLISGLPVGSPCQVVAAGVARLRGCPLLQLGRDWTFQGIGWSPCERRLEVAFGERFAPGAGRSAWAHCRLRSRARVFDLAGALALAGAQALFGPGPEAGEAVGLGGLASGEGDWSNLPLLEPLPGRFEVARIDPPLVLDGAQSPEAAAAVMDAWWANFRRAGPPRVLLALGRDKEAVGFLEALAEGGVRSLTVLQADGPRGREAEELAALARGGGLEAQILEGGREGLAAWMARPEGPWLVTGSLYLVGAIHALAGGGSPSNAFTIHRTRT